MTSNNTSKMNGNAFVNEESGLSKDKNRRSEKECFLNRCRDIRVLVGFVVALGLLIGVGLPTSMEKYYWKDRSHIRRECQLPSQYRHECLPATWEASEYTVASCNKHGCCWDPYVSLEGEAVPTCFHCLPSPFSYKVVSKEDNCYAIDVPPWTLVDTRKTSYVRRKSVTAESEASLPLPIPEAQPRNLKVEVDYVSDRHMTVKIFDVDGFDFEPYPFLKYERGDFYSSAQGGNCPDDTNRTYDVTLATWNERLFIDIARIGDSKRSIFNTNLFPFLYSEQYLEFTASIPSSDVFGLGEGNHLFLNSSLKDGTTRTLFNRIPPNGGADDEGNQTVVESWYGSHPFYLCIEPDGKAHGVLFAHTSAIDITGKAVPSLTFRTNGRSTKFYVFMGPTPADVIRQLTSVVGKPAMPPYWAMGHHVCRSIEGEINESSFSKIEQTVIELNKKRIPQESDCVFDDILEFPWKNGRFTKSYSSLADKFKWIHEIKLNLVHSPLVEQYGQFSNGNSALLRNKFDKPYSGLYKNKPVKYLDPFRDTASYDWIKFQLEKLANDSSNKYGFDGYFLTANTPIDERSLEYCLKASPAFVPGASYNNSGPAFVLSGTVCLDLCHKSDICSEETLKSGSPTHYNLHNLYGHGHAENVYHAAMEIKKLKRPFVVSLSTFTGTGRYAGHWGGQLEASWKMLKMSLVQMLEFNLYGIPLTGMPACGYDGVFDKNLCSRWAQLSAFQTLTLTYHRVNFTKEKHAFVDDDFIGSVAAAALQIRYALMPYFYTVFHWASVHGDPVVRPLFYQFPRDPIARNIDEQFLWGSDLLISPVLYPSTTSFKAYFPEGTWYDFYDGSMVYKGTGNWITLSANEYHINVHIRGGSIIASQRGQLNTKKSRKQPFKIQVALDQRATKQDEVLARGELYIDDGESVNGKSFSLRMLATNNNSLILEPSENVNDFLTSTHHLNRPNLTMNAVHVIGVKTMALDPKCGMVINVNDVFNTDQDPSEVSCKYNALQGVLSFRDLSINITQNCVLYWNIEKN